jgi:hypothetical protein
LGIRSSGVGQDLGRDACASDTSRTRAEPNSGQGDRSRLSCSAGDKQLGAGFCRDLQQAFYTDVGHRAASPRRHELAAISFDQKMIRRRQSSNTIASVCAGLSAQTERVRRKATADIGAPRSLMKTYRPGFCSRWRRRRARSSRQMCWRVGRDGGRGRPVRSRSAKAESRHPGGRPARREPPPQEIGPSVAKKKPRLGERSLSLDHACTLTPTANRGRFEA